ncbi:MAG TPA: small nuclear ribonucleoprotein [Thermoplasmatales archaeon]|nr:small nuclear ribonucleoprotein [Thermoplasmatales archaeon]
MMPKPLEVLHRSLNTRVIVELRGNRGYRGILDGYDVPHMNLVLRDAEEIINGETVAKREKVIVRGDNIIYISPP